MSRTISRFSSLLAVAALAGCGTDADYEETARRATVPQAPPAAVQAPAPEPEDTGEGAHGPERIAASAVPAAGVEPAGDPHAAYLEAEKLYLAGDRERAIGRLDASIATRPGFAPAHYLLGLAERKAGSLSRAEIALREALRLMPGHVRARVNLARVLVDLDRPGEAIDALASIDVAAGGLGSDVWNVRGLAHLTGGSLDEAEAAFKEATRVDPENLWAWNNLGLTRIRLGDFAGAIEPLETAAAFENAPAYVHNNLGVARERTGELQRAAESLATALARGHERAGTSLARISERLRDLPAREAAGTEETPELASETSETAKRATTQP